VLGGFLVGPLVLACFVRIERRVRHPLLPLGYFNRRNFSTPILTNGLVQCAYIGGFTVAPFMVKALFGYTTRKTALLIAIRPVFFSIGASVAGRHDRRMGARFILPLTVISLAVVGWGVGYARPANTAAVTNAVDMADVGVAAGIQNMVGSLGAAIGTTVMLAVVGESTDGAVFAHAALAGTAIAIVSIFTGSMLETSPSELGPAACLVEPTHEAPQARATDE
jgi:DHA2 family methylenomycin A resistance protein-like MFS transporter